MPSLRTVRKRCQEPKGPLAIVQPIALLLVAAVGLAGSPSSAQFPSTGLNSNSSFLSTDIDSVDLSSGNVNVHIPLVAFPQKGEKLRLAFNIRYNQPLWSIFADVVNPTSSFIRGHWILNNTQYYAYSPSPTLLSPLGVDIVRDQGITVYQTYQQYPCTSGGQPVDCDGRTTDGTSNTSTSTAATYIRDRTGASHIVGVDLFEPRNVGGVHLAAPDGSGWTQNLSGQSYSHGIFDIGTPVLDRSGLVYSSTIANASTGGHRTWNVTDADGNAITASGSGWVDSVGRTIPGSWGDLGEDDPYPGVPTSDLSHCDAGTSTARIWNVPGRSQPYYFCFQTFSGTTAFNVQQIGSYTAQVAEGSYSKTLLTQVRLPSNPNRNLSYRFTYDANYFELKRIDLPTGGYVAYTWNTIQANGGVSMPVRRVLTRREQNDGQTSAFWNYDWGTGAYDYYRGLIVSKPDGNDEWHRTIQPAGDDSPWQETVKYFTGKAAIASDTTQPPQGQVVRTVDTTYGVFNSPFYSAEPIGYYTMIFRGPVTSVKTTLDDGSVKETDYTLVPNGGSVEYENPSENLSWQHPTSHSCLCLNYNQIQDVKEYDYGSGSAGTLLRDTYTTYAFQQPNNPYLAVNMIDLPASVRVSDTNGLASSATYAYDESRYSPGSLQGSLTTVSRSIDGTNSIATHTSYNSAGVVSSRIDGMGNHADVLSYQCSGAFPGEVAQARGTAVEQHVAYGYDCNTGSLTSVVDANQKTTSYTYNDPLARLTGISYPDGGSTTVSYIDGFNSSVTKDTLTGASQGDLIQTTSFDGLGRPIASSISGGKSVYTRYDLLGRTAATSNPTTASAQAATDWTSYAYDALGRVHLQCDSDNGNSPGTCSPGTSYQQWDYAGPTSTHSDEQRNSWQQTGDALGRVIRVVEPTGSATTYRYDANDNLTTVNQPGIGGETPRVARSFGYDQLSRPYKAFNVETGWFCYGVPADRAAATGTNCPMGSGYDANGNIQGKVDSRGYGLLFHYDELNRLTGKQYFGPGYIDGNIKSFFYDGHNQFNSSVTPGEVGRLTAARSWAPFGNGLHDEQEWHDSMGRVLTRNEISQSESGTAGHSLSLTYDKAGNQTTLTYPDGRSLSYGYDSAGRLNSLTDGTGLKYVANIAYSSDNTQTTAFGNGTVETLTVNGRLQPCDSQVSNADGSVKFLDRQYFYGMSNSAGTQCNAAVANNGNIWHVMSGLPNAVDQQHYLYDTLNRLTQWNGNNVYGALRQQRFGYDSFGNMLPAWGTTTPDAKSRFDANNHLLKTGSADCTHFDGAGNMDCAGTVGSDEYDSLFNEEEQLVVFKHVQNNSPPTWIYSYDSNGNRVRSDQTTANGSVSWREYTYLNGQMMAEKDQTGKWTDHIYANGRGIAQVASTQSPVHEHIEHATNGCFVTFGQGGLASNNYTVQQGDTIYTDYKATGAYWGYALYTADSPQRPATYLMLPDTAGTSKRYTADLSSLQGRTLTAWAPAAYTQAAVADGYLSHLTIVSTNGAVTPIYTGQSFGADVVSDGCSYTNASASAQPINIPEVRYFIADQVGTAQLELSDSGTPLWLGEFAPFGQELENQFTSNRYKFTGKERDTESGLDYFGARYYGSSMGRFMSPDPSGLFFADQSDPQSLNLYSYARNNPVRNIDPNGLDCVYLNDAGNGVDRDVDGNLTGIDHNSNSGECNENGGYWAPGNVNEKDSSSVQTSRNNDLAVIKSNDKGQNLTSVANCQGCSTLNPDGTLLGAYTQTFGNQSTLDYSTLSLLQPVSGVNTTPTMPTIGPYRPYVQPRLSEADIVVMCTAGVSLRNGAQGPVTGSESLTESQPFRMARSGHEGERGMNHSVVVGTSDIIESGVGGLSLGSDYATCRYILQGGGR